MRRLAGTALALSVLTACTSTHPKSAAPSPTSSAARPTATALPPQQLRWTGCSDGFECARLRVPVDHSRPGGPTLSLAVIRLPASGPGSRLGSLVLNPGGPGASGVDYARRAPTLVPAVVRARYDVVGFDPRGIGGSEQVHCLSTAEMDRLMAFDPTADTPAQLAALDAEGRRVAAACSSHDPAFLARIGTVDTARDLDDLRAALGDAKLTYLGKSYGTFLGATYAELFPDRVRAFVLDGVVDPALTAETSDEQQAVAFETALRRFLAACPRLGCGLGADAPRALDGLLAGLRGHPLTSRADPSRPVTYGVGLIALVAGMYSRENGWPSLALALALAARGDGTGLQELADAYSGRQPSGRYDGSLESNLAINCVDRPYPRGKAAGDEEAVRLARVAPHFGPEIAFGSRACGYWPIAPTDRPHPVTAAGTPTMLLVGNTYDPATPLVWAQGLSRELAHDVLLTVVRDGHTAYGGGRSQCVDQAVNSYLLTLRAPAPRTSCPA